LKPGIGPSLRSENGITSDNQTPRHRYRQAKSLNCLILEKETCGF
jgi:hypothetical protein